MSEGTGGSFLTSGTPAGGTGAPPPDMTTAQGAVDSAVESSKWPEWVVPKYRGEVDSSRLDDIKFWRDEYGQKVSQGYKSAESYLGRDKVPVPISDDDEEGWSRLYKAAGWPEKPDEYEFKRPELPTDMPYDEDGEKYIRNVIHEAKLNKKQAEKIYDNLAKLQIQRHAAWHESQKKTRSELEQSLIREHGPKIEAVKQSAHAVMNKYADGEFRQYLDETGYGNDPRMVRFLAAIAKDIGGETRLRGAPVSTAQPADLKKAIDEHFSKNKDALMSKTHPQHQRALEERAKLFQALHPDQG